MPPLALLRRPPRRLPTSSGPRDRGDVATAPAPTDVSRCAMGVGLGVAVTIRLIDAPRVETAVSSDHGPTIRPASAARQASTNGTPVRLVR